MDGVKNLQRVVLNGADIKLFSRDLGAVTFSQKRPKFLSQQLGGGSLGGAVAPMPGTIFVNIANPTLHISRQYHESKELHRTEVTYVLTAQR